MEQRTTPEGITSLAPNEIFVFGSNYAGRHGKGAALAAVKWGARYFTGEGLVGQTYALPTKGYDLRLPLSIARIAMHVGKFIECARANPDKHFLVTAVGTGLAGYGPKHIAPLFLEAAELPNVSLPESFWGWLEITA